MAKNKNVSKNQTNTSHQLVTDVFGRNLSYVLSCLDTPTYQLTSIDLDSCELESGYTPLHVTLKLGYLQKAFLLNEQWKTKVKNNIQIKDEKLEAEKIWTKKDREGLSPLELYKVVNHLYTHNGDLNATRERYSHQRGAKTMYTFGSNTSMQLGTGDSNDRQTLYDIHLEHGSKFKKVHMQKYHSVIQTMDGSLFTCGNNAKNRMGFKLTNNIKSQPEYQKLQIASNKTGKLAQLEVSENHGLALLDNGDLVSWGSNEYSQLGYSTTDKDFSDPKVIMNQTWKKRGCDTLFIAVSNVHSCIIDSENYLYSWGLNLGQMGTSTIASAFSTSTLNTMGTNTHILASFKGSKGSIVVTPYGFKLPKSVSDIKQIILTEFVTLIFHHDNELFVISNFKTYHFTIPKLGQQQNSFDKFVPSSLSKPNKVVKIAVQNRTGNNLCALYENGTVGIFSIKQDSETSDFWNNQPYILPFKLYWVPSFEWNRCLDFAVGSEGQIILCTVGGDVYFTPTLSRNVFKKNRSSKLNTGKCVSVSCDSKFLAFSILKDDVDSPMRYCSKNGFYKNVAKYSPLLLPHCISNYQNSTKLNFDFYGTNTESDDYSDSREFFEKSFKITVTNENCRDMQDNLEYDVEFVDCNGDMIGKCHKLILACRCSLLLRNLEEYGYMADSKGSVKYTLMSEFKTSDGWKILVDLKNSETLIKESFKYALHYAYSDMLVDSFDPNFDCSSYLSKEFTFSVIQFVSSLGMNVTQYVDDKLHSCVQRQLFQDGDVTILLDNGNENINVHSLIMSTGSVFFENLFKGHWGKNQTIIEFSQFTKNEFEFIVKYIYGYDLNLLLEHEIHHADDSSIVNFYLQVLNMCDYFVMEELKNTVELLLTRYICAEYCIPILVYSHDLNCANLFDSCCWYVFNNVGLLFQTDNSQFIKTNFTDLIWRNMEKRIENHNRSFNGDPKVEFPSWYSTTNKAKDLIKVFKKDISAFNEVFMDVNHTFKPLFDFNKNQKSGLNYNNTYGKNRKLSNSGTTFYATQRRTSSVSGSSKSAAFVADDLETFRMNSAKSRNNSVFEEDVINDFDSPKYQSTQTTNSDSDNEFIEVKKGNFKRSSSFNRRISIPDSSSNTATLNNEFYKLKNDTKNSASELFLHESESRPMTKDSLPQTVSSNTSRNSSIISLGGTATLSLAKKSVEASSNDITPADPRPRFPSLSEVLNKSNGINKSSMDKDKSIEKTPATKIIIKKVTQKDRIKHSEEQVSLQKQLLNEFDDQKKKIPWNIPNNTNTPKYMNVDFPSLNELYKNNANNSTKGKLNFQNAGHGHHNHSKNVPLNQHEPNLVHQSTPGMLSYFRNIKNSNKSIQKPSVQIKSIDECRQELEFEKWWAKEAQRVQDEMKKQQEYEEKLMAVYGSTDTQVSTVLPNHPSEISEANLKSKSKSDANTKSSKKNNKNQPNKNNKKKNTDTKNKEPVKKTVSDTFSYEKTQINMKYE